MTATRCDRCGSETAPGAVLLVAECDACRDASLRAAADAMVAALIAAGRDRGLAVRFDGLDGSILTVIAGRVPGGAGMSIGLNLREFTPHDAGRILDNSDVAEYYPVGVEA